jgi:IS30 family transposase
MACHQDFTQRTLIPVYFCDPASPWQRGSNENSNGLLRQYFPKGTDLAVHTPEHLATVADQLNRRPREVLGWESPLEHLTMLASPLTDS